jgi:cyclopropane fatty-acyl-phospholipid synthase-like methyltransferase
MTDDAADIVRRGYNAIAERYRDWSSQGGQIRQRFLQEALVRLTAGSRVLDLGCGSGQPVAEALARDHYVLGIDLSPRQVELAQQAVPHACFEVADLVTFEADPASFDAVVSFYVLGHIPSHLHRDVYARIAGWLKPGGSLLTSAPVTSGDEVTPDWLGVPMYFGGIGEQATRQAVQAAGLEIELAEVVLEGEDEPGVSFLWLIARKPGGRSREGSPT